MVWIFIGIVISSLGINIGKRIEGLDNRKEISTVTEGLIILVTCGYLLYFRSMYGGSLKFVFLICFLVFLVMLFVADYLYYLVPIDYLLIWGGSAFILRYYIVQYDIKTHVLDALVFILITGVLAFLLKHGIGLGDFYFIMVIALVVHPIFALYTLLYGILVGGTIASLIFIWGLNEKYHVLPFIPFLVIGILITNTIHPDFLFHECYLFL